MNKWYPLRYIAALIWIGFLLAISFMEAPLKFQAPSVTLAIGLEIGQLVFQTLNKVEWVLLLMIILSLILSESNRRSKVLVSIVALILLIQTFYLLPELDRRAEMIIAGTEPPASNLHLLYVLLEIFKLVLLFFTSVHFIYYQRS